MLIVIAIHDTLENRRGEYTAKCLQSIQDTVDWDRHRLVLVNNNSCEHTANLLLLAMTKGHEVINNPTNIGTAEAVNIGIRKRFLGEVVCKADNDVVWNSKGWADELEETILSDPAIGILGLKRKDVWQRVDHENAEYRTVMDGKLELCDDIMGTCTAFNPLFLDRVGYMRQIGIYGGDDNIFSQLSLICGFRNAFLPHIDIDHIDVGGDIYCEWKKRTAGNMMAEMSILIEQYRSGTLDVYYNPFE